jgi:regulation of enolase protein 1 (concanavalin A-like superfamily)
MHWYNEPTSWTVHGDAVIICGDRGTDFWRKTHYGFIRDNGHFYYEEVRGDFQCDVKITGHYAALYDQAGLMVRVDETTWLKCGIEFVDGVQQVSAVVTRDYSDWSVVPLPDNPASLWLRLTRTGPAVEISYSVDGSRYALLRLAYLTEADRVQAGLMCAAPQGDGFSTTFEGFAIRPLA